VKAFSGSMQKTSRQGWRMHIRENEQTSPQK